MSHESESQQHDPYEYSSVAIPETLIRPGFDLKAFGRTEAATFHTEINHDNIDAIVLKSPFMPESTYQSFIIADGHFATSKERSIAAKNASLKACEMVKQFSFLSLDADSMLCELGFLFKSINSVVSKLKPQIPNIGAAGRTTLSVVMVLQDAIIFRSSGDSPVFKIDMDGNVIRASLDHGNTFNKENLDESYIIQCVLDNIETYRDFFQPNLDTYKVDYLMENFVTRNELISSIGMGNGLHTFGGVIPIKEVQGIFMASDGVKDALSTEQIKLILQDAITQNLPPRKYSNDFWKINPELAMTKLFDEIYSDLDIKSTVLENNSFKYPVINSKEALLRYNNMPDVSIRTKDDDRSAFLALWKREKGRIFANPSYPSYKIRDINNKYYFEAKLRNVSYDKELNKYFAYFILENNKIVKRDYLTVKEDNADILLKSFSKIQK